MRNTYTEKQVNEVLTLYQDPTVSLKEIVERTGVNQKTINYWVTKHNIPKRRPQLAERLRKCTYCKRTFELKDAQFCPYCGKDIRTKEEVLKFEVRRLYSYQSLLPSGTRDEYSKLVGSIVNMVNDLAKESR